MADIRTVIAVTGEDDRYETVRRAGIDRAAAEQATLILYDVDAETSPFESPLPTAWSADGTEEKIGDRLGPDELEAAGREAIARQVREARGRGIDAWGWLPSDAGKDALMEYASHHPGAHVLVPGDNADFDLADVPHAEAIPTLAR